MINMYMHDHDHVHVHIWMILVMFLGCKTRLFGCSQHMHLCTYIATTSVQIRTNERISQKPKMHVSPMSFNPSVPLSSPLQTIIDERAPYGLPGDRQAEEVSEKRKGHGHRCTGGTIVDICAKNDKKLTQIRQ